MSGKLHRIVLCHVVFCIMLIAPLAGSGQINVAPGQTAIALAQKLAGQGVTVLNPVLTCPSQANGFFSVVSSNLGLDSGIVLTTGRAATIPGFYGINGPSDALANFENGTPGDAALTVLARKQTMDACKLEFDVVPAGDTVSINYVFSSEEYINAVCGPYNDVFAFFISGPGIAGVDNMALVPGTTIPVAINSINNGVPGSSGTLANCTDMGTGSPFTAYYKDNTNGTTLTHRGLTTVLRAMHVVSPCDTYHFKIAIADAHNGKYDSGVFLEAGSLKTGDYKVQAVAMPVYDSLAPICVKGCLPGRFRIRNPLVRPVPQTIRYTTSGTAVSGVDYQPLADSVVIPPYAASADVLVYGIPTALNGTKEIKMVIYAPSVCSKLSYVADSAIITIYDTLHIVARPADTLVCGGDSVQLRVAGDDIYSYSWVPAIALSNRYIKEPIAAPVANTVYTVTAFLPGASCPFRSAQVAFTIRPTPQVSLIADTIVCYRSSFLLAPAVAPPNSFYSYQWVGPGGFTSTAANPQLSNVTVADSGLYRLVVVNDTNGCKVQSTANVIVYTPVPPVALSPAYYCLNTTLPIALNADGVGLQWYDTAGTLLPSAPVPPVNNISVINYRVSQTINGCESPRALVAATIEQCCTGDIFIPTAFTPNDDGLNDRFRPLPDFSYSLKNLSVFNRWGQVVYSGNVGSWDGTVNGLPAPADTYYYRVLFSCILGGTAEKTGDVILIR